MRLTDKLGRGVIITFSVFLLFVLPLVRYYPIPATAPVIDCDDSVYHAAPNVSYVSHIHITDSGRLFIYSAYFNVDLERLTVLASFPRVLISVRRTCLVVLKGEHTRLLQTDAHVEEIGGGFAMDEEDEWKEQWGTFFIHCKLYTQQIYGRWSPASLYAVAIVHRRCQSDAAFIHITNNGPQPDTLEHVLCVPSVYQYHKAPFLIEYLELHKSLGVQRVIMYKSSVSHNVSKVLEYYERQKFVEVLEWDLIEHFTKNASRIIHYYGQNLCMNDCLLRYKYRARYLAAYDLDEVITPEVQGITDWAQMITHISRETGAKQETTGGYTIQSVFEVPKRWLSEYKNNERIIASLYGQELTTILPPFPLKYYYRSKVLLQPKFVEMIGVHLVYQAHASNPVIPVSHQLALVHHMRDGWDWAWQADLMDYCCHGDKSYIGQDASILQLFFLSRVKGEVDRVKSLILLTYPNHSLPPRN